MIFLEKDIKSLSIHPKAKDCRVWLNYDQIIIMTRWKMNGESFAWLIWNLVRGNVNKTLMDHAVYLNNSSYNKHARAKPLLYPMQRVAEGIMFLTCPSVSQSVTPVFLVSATPLKPLNRILWNFVVMKDIICWCEYPQELDSINFFFSQLRLFWT